MFEWVADGRPWMCVDVDTEIPKAVINRTDVQLTALAFDGAAYPLNVPVHGLWVQLVVREAVL